MNELISGNLVCGKICQEEGGASKGGEAGEGISQRRFSHEYMRLVDRELVIVSKSHLFERLDDIGEQLYRRHFDR